jgi:hypothetical protein
MACMCTKKTRDIFYVELHIDAPLHIYLHLKTMVTFYVKRAIAHICPTGNR